MSKSYNNTIPLFLPAKKLRKLVMKIVTNSQTIDEPKNPDECNVFTLYKLFANEEQQEALRRRYLAGGMGWGTAKQELFEVMDAYLAPMRQKYEALMADTAYMETVLRQGAEKAAAIVSEKMTFLRAHMGM